jgi:hypothetical protein
MTGHLDRRDFLQLAATGTTLAAIGGPATIASALPVASRLISPGCRRSRVKVARIYMGTPEGLWPKPNLDFQEEIRSYQAEFDKLKDELSDVDFVTDHLLTSPQHVQEIKSQLQGADGILAIHLSIGITPILDEVLTASRPTVVFAVPYSGHEWAQFGALRNQPAGAHLECMLTSDYRQLAAAVRPFRAIHHLREAKILDLTTNLNAQYADAVKKRFGTEIRQIDLPQVRAAYNAVSDREARDEAARWMQPAVAVVEPSRDDIIKSCKLALAFEKLLDEADATVMTVDCYGTMWDRTIKLPAYPCLGFARLNNMGLGGICESDLQCALTHILLQGLSGRPGFISDPTMDESQNSIILAHCLGSTRMAGPQQPAEPYKLRTVMERQEGVVPQVRMRVGQRVTQAKLVGTDLLLYFTGQITDAPASDRGCRTKITVRLDGNAEKLWKNWSQGLHRVTCYGDLAKDLERFGRFTDIKLVNEAA